MGIFSRSKTDSDGELCPHDFLDPRWESMDDVSCKECVDHFVCRRCGVKFMPARVREAMTGG